MTMFYEMNFKFDKKNTYRLEIEELFKLLESKPTGLNSHEALRRLEIYGPNELPEGEKKTPLAMFLDQFKDPMIVLLLAAAIISGAVGEAHDTIVILVIVVLNSVVGLVQEYRAEKALEALKAMSAPEATVIRDGRLQKIPATKLVPGDIVLLEAGQVVPADLRLIESAGLKVDESPLTGESIPVEKMTKSIQGRDIPLADQRNMAFMGTTVTYGRGRGLVVATGRQTEMGSIARLLGETESVKTPLQRRLARVGRNLAIAALLICAIVFIAGMTRGENILNMFLTAISLAVAAVPEALPAMVTISLALGAKQMAKENALIRRLPAVETLGSVTYICSDKTGTLTMNKMRVEAVVGPDGSFLEDSFEGNEDLLLAMAVSNDVEMDKDGNLQGDPTEIALYEWARARGFKKEELIKKYPRVAEIPFSSERQAMTTIHKCPGGNYLVFTKGGFEAVISRCSSVDEKYFEKMHLKMASEGLRVLAFGKKRVETLPDDLETLEQAQEFLGLVGAMDPPRPEAKYAVETCHSAGIKPVMITGDHPLTARAIAKRIGILKKTEDNVVLTGQDLASMSREEIKQVVEQVRVYARVAPEQKLTLVSALQENGEAVAMTGDGVNDAPALKQADIGVAMGVTGTDVAKQAADMILLDDNFATIVRSVMRGRQIYDNIRKFFKFLLASNAGEIWTIFLAPFLGLPIPLLPIHILWVNLVTDGAPSLALTAEAPERDIMKRPPRRPSESLFAQGMWQHILWVGLLMGGLCLGLQKWAIETGHHWQTMVFTTLCFCQFAHVLAIRSEKDSLFTMGLSTNWPLVSTIVISIGVQLLVIYNPFLHHIFKIEPLDLFELLLCFGVSSIIFWAVEVEKLLVRKGVLRYS